MGMGLKNALHTVEDSGGMGEVSCENGVFQVYCYLELRSFGNKNCRLGTKHLIKV